MKKNRKTDTPFNTKEQREDILREWAKETDMLECYKRYLKFDQSANRKKIVLIVMSVIMVVLMIMTLFFPSLVWFVWTLVIFSLFETLDMRIDQLWALRMVDNILGEYQLKKKEEKNGKSNSK